MKETNEIVDFQPEGNPAGEVLDEVAHTAVNELSEDVRDVEEEREEYERAREKMTSRIRELRSSLKFRLERVKSETERQSLIESESASLAGSFKDSEQLAILKRLMPNRANADTSRQKFSLIIELGLQMPYWSTENFLYAYDKKFGKGAERELDAEAEELYDAFLAEFPELEELADAA